MGRYYCQGNPVNHSFVLTSQPTLSTIYSSNKIGFRNTHHLFLSSHINHAEILRKELRTAI